MANARFRIDDGKLVIEEPGPHKFKEEVDQITFSGRRALEKGKKVYYVTNVGAFRLTERGMELSHIMPGLDVEKDIIGPCPMKIVLPESGGPRVVDRSVVTGEGFQLKWPETPVL
jgi:propionate CoA-transferase